MFLNVNDVNIYYEKSGNGQPLIMLHGNGESHSIFDKAVSVLKESFTVYTLDFRNHGQSTKVESYSYTDHVDDVYEFIEKLNISSPQLYGFSDGGIVGIMLAIKYPDLLSRLIVSGPNITPDGVRTVFFNLWKVMYKLTKSPNLYLMLNEPNIPLTSLKEIRTPVFLTGGSHDLITQEHLKLIADNIPGCKMKIFRFSTHSSYIVNSTEIAPYILSVQ